MKQAGAFLLAARELGAAVLLAPHEGPAGWRSVIATTEAGEIALWQQQGWR
jgi:predicted enzyme related to lactoylglutathione lyase